jgi:hypothetical protein
MKLLSPLLRHWRGVLVVVQTDSEISPLSALLLAEDGHAPLNPPEWIANLRPQVILLNVAPDDREGGPSTKTLEAVKGSTLLRTDRNEWIELTTDGKQKLVEVERSNRDRL